MKNEIRVKFGKRKALIFVVLLATLVSVGIVCASATITVCHSGCDYASIQAAVDAADSEDTIEVHSGTYREHVDVNKQLTLRGVDTGTGKPVVDAGESGNAITLSAGGITLEGFSATKSGTGIKVTSNTNILANNTANYNGMGIQLVESCNNALTGNSINYNEWDGLALDVFSNNNTLSGNTVNHNKNGIWLSESSDNTITGNTASSSNDYDGIWLTGSSNNNILTGNTISNNNRYGISLVSSSNNKICLNNFQDNPNNVYSINSSNVWNSTSVLTYSYNSGTFTSYLGNYWDDYTGNDADKDGIGDTPYSIDGENDNYPLMVPFETYVISPTERLVHNINTGKNFSMIQAAINDSDTVDGHTITVDAGTYYENVVVNKSISLIGTDRNTTVIDGGEYRTVVDVTADNCVISGFTIQNSSYSNSRPNAGLRLSSSTNTKVLCNNIWNNKHHGIYLYNSTNTNITGNTASNNIDGILIGYSSNNTIMNNTISNNTYGIELEDLCINNTITGNIIYTNTEDGIELYDSDDNNICDNIIYSNNWDGIELYYSSNNNTISGNTVSSNSFEGIVIRNSSNNLIYHNNLINNANQAYDNTGNNSWDNGYPSGGNYWSDYGGSDNFSGPNQDIPGGDEIGDTLYTNISGGAGAQDRYPFMSKNGWLCPYTKTDVGATSNITSATPTDLAAYLPPEYTDTDISDAIVLNVNVTDITPDTTDAAYTDITINIGSMDIETCKVFKTDFGFLLEVNDITTLPTVSGEPAFSRDVVNKTVTARLYVGDPLLGVIPAAVGPLGFDTGEGTYPSIMGMHNGTIIPSRDINVSKLYTYPCAGTGGHTESVKLYENATLIASGVWGGYEGDYHNLTLDNETGASYVMLLKGHSYNYTIVTGSYPQIIHSTSNEVTGGTITCSSFVAANGKVYYDWIPAIRLE